MPFATTWRDPEGIMLGEINQTPRDKNYIPLIHAIEEKSSKIQRTDWVASGGGGGTG